MQAILVKGLFSFRYFSIKSGFLFFFTCIFLLIFLYWRQSILGFIFSFLLCKFLSNPDIRDLFICLMLLKYDLLENLIWLTQSLLLSGFLSESFYWSLELLDSISHWSMEWFWWLLVQGWLEKKRLSKSMSGLLILFQKNIKIWNQHSFIP